MSRLNEQDSYDTSIRGTGTHLTGPKGKARVNEARSVADLVNMSVKQLKVVHRNVRTPVAKNYDT